MLKKNAELSDNSIRAWESELRPFNVPEADPGARRGHQGVYRLPLFIAWSRKGMFGD
jgi:hypothetical protein